MKSFKNLIILFTLVILSTPFDSSAHTTERFSNGRGKSVLGMAVNFLKIGGTESIYSRNLEKRKKMAKAHRRFLLRKAKKSKNY